MERRRILGRSVVLFALVLLGPAPWTAASAATMPDRPAVADPWLEALVPDGMPAGATPFLVRTDRPLDAVPGLTVHGRRRGLAVVSGDETALAALTDAGITAWPMLSSVPAVPPPAPLVAARAPTWNPVIQQLVDQVEWDPIIAQLTFVSLFGERLCSRKVINTLESYLKGYGYAPERQRIDCNAYEYSYNLTAIHPGIISPDSLVVVCAHQDAFGPGADDNASGVAALLQLARLLAGHQFRYTICYLFCAREETGLVGSAAFADSAAAAGIPIVAALNCDMLGYWVDGVPRNLELESGTPWLMDLTTAAADLYTTTPYRVHEQDTWWGDHASFWSRGFAAMEHEEAYDYIDPDFNPYYHSDNDLPQYIHAGFMVDNVRLVLAELCVVADLVDAAVPVRLTRFAARREADTVRLEWAVSDALSTGAFRVFRRDVDGAVSRLAGEPRSRADGFAMIDAQPPATRAAYELEEQAADGRWIPLGSAEVEAAAAPPARLAVRSAGPNPFNPTAGLVVEVPRDGAVRVVVHDLRGRRVRTLFAGELARGGHALTWDGRDDAGRASPSGAYVVRVTTARGATSCKLLLAR